MPSSERFYNGAVVVFSKRDFLKLLEMERRDFTELIPKLPDEIGLECIARLPYTGYRVASGVCWRWRELLFSRELYHYRKKSGLSRKVACLIQALSEEVMSDDRKSTGVPSYGITVFDPVSQIWERLDLVPKYLNGLPLFCQVAGCEGKLIVMGGWDPTSYAPITDVFIYDFTRCKWRKGKDMPSQRSFFAVGSFSGRLYVAGGHDENKNALKSAWVYDLKEDEWAELTQMSQERDECEGVVIGNQFWVVSGYRTDRQGEFEGSAEIYDFQSGHWSRVDGACPTGRCPRSCVGVGNEGELTSYSELDSSIRVRTCGIKLGSRTFVSGSEYQGAPAGFYFSEVAEGQNSKLVRISVPDEYTGIVQSGCLVEI